MKKLTKKQKDFIFTKKGEKRKSIEKIQDTYRSENIYRPTTSYFRNGHGAIHDINLDVINLLNILNLKYKKGNDAPRGGQNGNYIKVSRKASDIINSL